MRVDWQDLSQRRFKEARKRVTSCESVFGGFSLVLDRIKHLTSKELEQLVKATGIDLRACGTTPKQHRVIRNKRDLVELLVACIASGKSMEVPVGECDICEWLNCTWAESSKLRVGGQAAHMALAACAMVPRVVVAGWPIPARFAERMPQEVDNIHLVVSHRGKMQVRPLRECRGFPGHEHANCAIHFSAGFELCMENFKLGSQRVVRLIANCLPRDEWMKQGTSSQLENSGTRVTHAFLSGCQLLCPDIDTDNLWPSQVLEFAKTVHSLRGGAECQAVHYEMGTIQSEPLLDKLVKELLTEVDSVGCNDDELVQILEAIGEKKLASQIKEEKSIESMYLGASHLVQLCELQRLHVHTWDFHVSVSRAGADTHVVERDALLFGAIMGAAKTYTQLDIQERHIKQGLEIPFSENGLKKVTELHENPRPLGTYIAHGIFQTDDDTLVCIVPGRVKPGLDSTIGLGDTLSSMAFLAAAG